MKKIAIYPGSFDPVTNGHMDLIKRGLKIFDKVIVTILCNPGKKSLFTVDERKDMLRECLKDFSDVEVDSSQGLLVDYVVRRNAHAILRGMRAVSDFEYEFQMALTNRNLAPDVETVFLMPHPRYSFVSSRLIKEVAELGAKLDEFLPKLVVEAFNKKNK